MAGGAREVTVVVPARDAEASIVGLLDALAQQTLGPAAVVVVDDASTDRTGELAAAHPLRPSVLRGPGRGSYAARNVGLTAVETEVVAFTDADCLPQPGWLAVAAAEVEPGVLVAGVVRQQRRDGAGVCERYDRATYLDQGELVVQGFGATANLVAMTADLRRLGGFDGSLRSSGDKELGSRSRRMGLELRLVESAVVAHAPRTDLPGLWRLHRRLGAGWRDLARRELAPPWWREPGLRVPLGHVVELVAADGPPLRRRRLAPVHAVVLAARWRGRLLG
jgi:GT2 family glycosyltransferase